MKLKDLSPVLRSTIGAVQMAAVYDVTADTFLADGCSVEYAIKHYGELTIDRVTAYGDYLVLDVRTKGE